MDAQLIFFLLLTIILPFAVIFGIVYLLKTIRRTKMSSFAQNLGFSFSEKGDTAFIERFPEFNLFASSNIKKIANVLKGEKNSKKLLIFNYTNRDTSYASRMTNVRFDTYTVIAFESENLKLPKFFIRPKEFVELKKDNVVKFEGNEIFTKRYLVQAVNESGIRMVLNQGMLNQIAQHKNWHIESNNNSLIFYQSKYLSPAKLETFLNSVERIINAFMSGSPALK